MSFWLATRSKLSIYMLIKTKSHMFMVVVCARAVIFTSMRGDTSSPRDRVRIRIRVCVLASIWVMSTYLVVAT